MKKPKSPLIEWFQKLAGIKPLYEQTDVSGPSCASNYSSLGYALSFENEYNLESVQAICDQMCEEHEGMCDCCNEFDGVSVGPVEPVEPVGGEWTGAMDTVLLECSNSTDFLLSPLIFSGAIEYEALNQGCSSICNNPSSNFQNDIEDIIYTCECCNQYEGINVPIPQAPVVTYNADTQQAIMPGTSKSRVGAPTYRNINKINKKSRGAKRISEAIKRMIKGRMFWKNII